MVKSYTMMFIPFKAKYGECSIVFKFQCFEKKNPQWSLCNWCKHSDLHSTCVGGR